MTDVARHLDFGRFWGDYLHGGVPDEVAPRVWFQAKRDLLKAGVPALTVCAYFRHLYYLLNNDFTVSLIEEIISDLEEVQVQTAA